MNILYDELKDEIVVRFKPYEFENNFLLQSYFLPFIRNYCLYKSLVLLRKQLSAYLNKQKTEAGE